MCNPRRLEVRLTQEIEEEWRATAQEEATARVEVSERLERVISLADRLGPSARLGLSAALAEGFRGWRAVDGEDGRFEIDVGRLHLSLDTESARLTVTLEREGSVMATASAEAEYSATVHGTVEARENGTAYEDGYGGRDVETVDRELREKAQAGIERERERVIDEQTREAREEAERRAADEARQRAETEAAARGEKERTRLAEELEELLRESLPVLHEEVAALVGETLRRSVLHLVRVNGGELRRCEETDDAIVIEAIL